MKNFRSYLQEASTRNVPVEKTKATPTQKALVKRDIGRRQAVKAASGVDDFKTGARKIADVRGEMEAGLERGAAALKQAKEYDATTVRNPSSGRVVADPELKKLAKQNPEADAAAIATRNKQDDDQTERQRIVDMPRGPERTKLLRQNMLKRMAFARNAGDISAGDLGIAANRAIDKEMRAGEGENAFQRTNVQGVDIASQSGMRHNWQGVVDQGYDTPEPSQFPDPTKSTTYTHDEDGRQYNYNNDNEKWMPVLSDDDVDNLIATVSDPTQDTTLTRGPDGEVIRKYKVQNTELGNNAQVFEPSAAELAYFKNDPEGQELIKALDSGDARSVHNIIFTHDVPDEAVNAYINRADTRTDLSRRGLDAGKKLEAVYGGTFKDELKEIAQKYQVEGAPEGVYNTKQIEKDGGKRGGKWQDPNLERLYNEIFENRQRESIRTYLKQGGRDGYVRWEGNRSIEQMNLEHIEALNSDDPEAKGWDHPSNWAWASEPLNKAKNKYKLGDVLKKFDEPRIETKSSGGKGYQQLKKEIEKATGIKGAKLTQLFKDRVPALTMNRGDYQKLSQDEIDSSREEMIKMAQEIGLDINADTAKESLPDREAKPGYETDGADEFDSSRIQREKERMEMDTTLKQVRQMTGTSSLEDAANTPLGQAALDTLTRQRRNIDEIIPGTDEESGDDI